MNDEETDQIRQVCVFPRTQVLNVSRHFQWRHIVSPLSVHPFFETITRKDSYFNMSSLILGKSPLVGVKSLFNLILTK